MLAPLVCGALAQGLHSWRLGFAAAGVGMLLGLVQFATSRALAAAARAAPERAPEPSSGGSARLGVVAVLCCACVLFFTAFEQSGSSLTLFADRHTRHEILGWTFPSAWFQSVNAVFILLLAPLFSWLWSAWGARAPRSPAKFAIGLGFVGLGYLLLLPAALASADGAVSPLWLVGLYFLHTLGELCLSPVGLSTISKLAPARFAGLMLGVWMVSIAFGNYLSGFVAGFYDPARPQTGVGLFGALAVLGAAGGLLMAFLAPRLARRMGDVR
jgi:POT family proton-dependent oligopeptide transporter